MEKITAPFTQGEVDNINAYQQRDDVHPLTCPNNHGSETILEATKRRLICPECDYTQDWAWEMMARDW